MAQLDDPLRAPAIVHDTNKTWDPPSIPSPHHDRPRSEQSADHGTSDATLYSIHTQEDAGIAQPVEESGKDATLQKPHFVLTKFETEIMRPVTSMLSETDEHHPSSRNNFTPGTLSSEDTSSDSDVDISSDENRPTLRTSKTHPVGDTQPQFQLDGVRRRKNRPDYLKVGNKFFQSQGRLATDGRLNISVNETAQRGYLAKALGATIQRHLGPHHEQEIRSAEKYKSDFHRDKDKLVIPRLNIVIMVIGSRGDVQPFLKIGKVLRDKYNHRVRIASHPTFKKFVQEDVGLEFFSVGGDPSELMSFMVKNPGLIPSFESVKAGEVGRRRDSMFEMFQGFWRSCINATDDEEDVTNLEMMGTKPPFVADAIIANPPSFAHYHCAERLSIPLHLVFTFPYSPTQSFPHPLANIKSSNIDQSYTNFMSYPLVDLLIWQGIGDLLNRFRVQTLGLEPVSTLWAPGQLSRLKVPTTYLWSPGLVPKPHDWGPEIDLAGCVFLDLATSFKPPSDLAHFLERSDERPILYIGFGSISGLDDPRAFTRMIFDAVEKAGVRAIISRGWGGMGDGMDKPDGIFLVDNVPHDWLFPQVDAVVHHGGAGTTAAGLRFGKPTMIVPFFGDQPFWSNMVARAGAGTTEALPLKKLDVEKFAEGIRQCLQPEAKAKAQEIAKRIEEEGDGAENAVDSFHRALDLKGPHSLRCSILPDRAAVWQVKRSSTHLSVLAAELLVESNQIKWTDLELAKNYEWTDFQGPGEPITGAGGVVVQAFREACHGLTSIPDTAKRDYRRYGGGNSKKIPKSAIEGIVLPGRIAMATRGATVDEQQKEHDRIVHQVNFAGEAQPLKLGLIATDDSNHNPTGMVIKDVGRGIGHSGKAIAAMPVQIWNALALGFHNAPRLYGDKTVRPSPQGVTGFRKGVQVAGEGFWHGIYDGVTGIVRIPYLEVNDSGWSALPKGVARGFGGFVLKPIAGFMGLGAYTAKGVESSLRRRVRDTEKTDRWIQRARVAEGQRDVEHLQAQKHSTTETEEQAEADSDPDLDELRRKVLELWTTTKKDGTSEEHGTAKRLIQLTKMAPAMKTL